MKHKVVLDRTGEAWKTRNEVVMWEKTVAESLVRDKPLTV
jgi:hypothetical protein